MTKKHDPISRVKGSSPLGTSIFVGLRALDVYLQYLLLRQGTSNPPLNLLPRSFLSSPSTEPIIALNLPLKPLILLSMAAGTTLKNLYWAFFLTESTIPVDKGIPISTTPSFLNTPVAGSWLSRLFFISTFFYILGIVMETSSEIQRKNFKADSRNKGKLYTGGLFSLARHINYGGYIVMRAGSAMAAGGWLWGGVVGAFFTRDLGTRGVPVLDEYCTKRWADFKRKVSYKLLPGIY